MNPSFVIFVISAFFLLFTRYTCDVNTVKATNGILVAIIFALWAIYVKGAK